MAEITRLPGPVADLWDWQLEGACRGVSPEAFFHPEGERGPRRRNRDAAAKAYQWTQEFGPRNVVPAAVLAGVFKTHNLRSAQPLQ